MNEQSKSGVVAEIFDEIEVVFDGTVNRIEVVEDKCAKDCMPGTSANTAAMHATM